VAFLSILAIPFVMNARYMKAGLVQEERQTIVPTLETSPEMPPSLPPIPEEKQLVGLPVSSGASQVEQPVMPPPSGND
jgi:hypothetical protein